MSQKTSIILNSKTSNTMLLKNEKIIYDIDNLLVKVF